MVIRMWPNRRMETKDTKEERDKGEVCLDSRWMDDAWSIKLARTF